MKNFKAHFHRELITLKNAQMPKKLRTAEPHKNYLVIIKRKSVDAMRMVVGGWVVKMSIRLYQLSTKMQLKLKLKLAEIKVLYLLKL